MENIIIQKIVSHYQWFEREYKDIEIKNDSSNEWYISIDGVVVDRNELLASINMLEST